MRKIFGVILLLLALVTANVSAYASFYLNDEDVTDKISLRSEDGVTFVPLREVGDKLGLDVEWNDEKQCITVSNENAYREVYLDDLVVLDENGVGYDLPAAPVSVDGTAMIPVQFFGDYFWYDVVWDEVTDSIFVNSNEMYREIISSEEYEKASRNRYNTLTREGIRDLNIFLSNFSETSFDSYHFSSEDYDSFISFAYAHNSLNSDSEADEAVISADLVDQIIGRYFYGKSVPRANTENWTFDGTNFVSAEEQEGISNRIAIAANLIESPADLYSVDFSIYEAEEAKPQYYWYSYDEAESDDSLTLVKNGTAQLMPEYEGEERLWKVCDIQTSDAGGDGGYKPMVYATIFALLPPLIAILLALITKEVYSSLFIGIVTGALLYANFNPVLTLNTMLFNEDGGMVSKLADGWNVGILVFLVILGILVALMNKVGGSAAFGQWASKHIKSRMGTQLATIGLGVLIFIDDYFNCLTVGSVMRPVTDRQKISRAKLAYLIDATAAPVCIIAPVSSWAAAVTSSVPDGSSINGFAMFLNTIPYNLYAITTIIMMIFIAVKKFDFGPMKLHESNAMKGDLFTTEARPYGEVSEEMTNPKGKVIDLVFPIIVLIICCIIGMVYTGGFFEGKSFIEAFADADASQGLVLGSIVTLVISFIFYMVRRAMTFKEFTECIPNGFKAMVAPILILTLAWTLSGMTGLLGADSYVHDVVAASAGAVQMFLPAIIFAVALVLAFSTGTSWGTFAILIPIVCSVFSGAGSYEMLVISISACLAGAVCGDHCSPISDTTIMASAGAHCDHVNHVSTQLPYALTAAAVSAFGYLIAGILGYAFGNAVALIATPISVVVMILVLAVIKKRTSNEYVAAEADDE